MCALSGEGEAGRIFRFLATGVLNTTVGYLLFAVLHFAGLGKFAAIVAATAIGALFNFLSIGSLVFRQRGLARLPVFLAVYAAQCAVNVAGMRGLTAAGLTPYVAQLVLVPGLAAGTYVALRRFVFADIGALGKGGGQ